MVASISKSDWESFRAVGRVPPSIREVVLQSWKRSSKLAMASPKYAPMLAPDDLHTTRTRARRLRQAAQAALSKADFLLRQSGNMLLLCDHDCVVLDAAGDSDTIARGRENHLHLGGKWSETAIGTNAIGTAIHLGRSVQVDGPEHFFEEIQRWNCAASPIKDPGTGQLLGVLNISWSAGQKQPGSTALSSAFALQVESELAHRLAQDRQLLLQCLHQRRLSEPVLLLDRTGAEIFSSGEFAHAPEFSQALAGLRQRLPELIELGADRAAEALAGHLPDAALDVIEPRADAIGVVISLKARRARRKPEALDLAQLGRTGATMAELVAQAQRLLDTSLPILIEGETGTGKATLARAMHDAAPAARAGRFTMLECALLSDEGLRADMARGALALDGGTLCLDSPGRASPAVQKLLLSVIETAERAGCRVITLASRSLFQMMQDGSLHRELYYRIAGARLTIPPLRDRPAEIPLYLQAILARHRQENGGRELRFTASAMAVLRAHSWPGNLREMQNLVSAQSALSRSALIDARDLPPEIGRPPTEPLREDSLLDVEKAEIIAALDTTAGNMTEAARRLGIARSTLYLKLDAYGIARPRSKP
ncbi:sigma-54-dependent Fis family transcriptional regulator [Paracoccus sp. (in: a-proteobacteria)]